jgi:serine/threonine-protein kinase
LYWIHATLSSVLGTNVGNYKVLSQLGEGGMGVVYLAEHTAIGKRAALKMLLPQYCKSEAIVTRFFNEAKATAKLQHPGLVEIYDYGHHTDGSAYIVMEFLDGESLAKKLKREGALELQLVIELSRQIALALQVAHSHGIVHRDLKPDNVLLVPSEELKCGVRAKVLDFGIAKIIDHAEASQMKTRTGMLMGTPAYMSPEQCRGAKQIDQRADVYSLGAMMYEMASGAPPFKGEGLGEIIAAHLTESIPPLEPAPQLSPVCERALAKNPADRYQNMTELLADLDALLLLKTLPGQMRDKKKKKGSAGTWLAAVAVLALVGGGGAWLALGRRAHDGAGSTGAGAATATAAKDPAAGNSAAAGNPAAGNPATGNPAAGNPAAADPTTADPTTAPNAAAPTPTAPAEKPKVTLTVESTPPGAQVYRLSDGVKLGTTPFSAEYERGAGQAEFVLKLPGYRDAGASLPIDRDGEAQVVLQHAAAAHVAPAHGSSHKTPPSKIAAKPSEPAAPAPAPTAPPKPAPPPPNSRALKSGELHSPF